MSTSFPDEVRKANVTNVRSSFSFILICIFKLIELKLLKLSVNRSYAKSKTILHIQTKPIDLTLSSQSPRKNMLKLKTACPSGAQGFSRHKRSPKIGEYLFQFLLVAS